MKLLKQLANFPLLKENAFKVHVGNSAPCPDCQQQQVAGYIDIEQILVLRTRSKVSFSVGVSGSSWGVTMAKAGRASFLTAVLIHTTPTWDA